MDIKTKQIENYLVEVRSIYEIAITDARIERTNKLKLVERKIKNAVNTDIYSAEIDKKLTEEIAKFGGKISGISRTLKTNLIMFFLKQMKIENKEYFKNYSVRNYAKLSKKIFDTTLSNKTISALIDDKTASRATKNRREFSNQNLFKEHLETVVFDDVLSKIVDRYYQMFKNTMKDSKRLDRNAARKIEKAERTIFLQKKRAQSDR